MGRSLLVGLLAFAVALAGTAYAEVQSIKVGGDIDIKAITQSNYDLKLTQENRGGTVGGDAADTDDDDVRFALSTVRVRVDADLTDNVSTSVRLLNQRVWDSLGAGDSDDEGSIHIDNAYVTLKEFLYSPLTVIAGRQNLVYGTGFIVGNGLLADPTGTFAGLSAAAGTLNPHGLQGQEYSAFNSYDAIRLILDYAPLTVEGVWAKVNETGLQDDDETLYGALVNYKLDRWEAEVEPYWFFKDDEAGASTLGTAGGTVTVGDATSPAGTLRTYEVQRTHTVGLRAAASPIENLKLSGEGAHQFGEIIDTAGETYQERDRDAWGANVYANYTWAQAPWTPATGVGWTFFSGEETSGTATAAGGSSDGRDQTDDFSAWDPVYRGSFTTYIQDFFSGRDAAPNLYTTFDANDTNATTNRHLFYGDLKLSPMEDVTLWGRWTHVRFDEEPRPSRDSHVGDELDIKALYDYTEDVQLAVWGGWFFPGSYYDEPESNSRGNQMAWTLGTGGSVKF